LCCDHAVQEMHRVVDPPGLCELKLLIVLQT
jgi:hypothetical protein